MEYLRTSPREGGQASTPLVAPSPPTLRMAGTSPEHVAGKTPACARWEGQASTQVPRLPLCDGSPGSEHAGGVRACVRAPSVACELGVVWPYKTDRLSSGAKRLVVLLGL